LNFVDHFGSHRKRALVNLVVLLEAKIWAFESELLRTMLRNVVRTCDVYERMNELISSSVTFALQMQRLQDMMPPENRTR
jgi:hypothetical protein